MRFDVVAGDLLDEHVDALFCSANPWLAMSGGVGGTILQRGGASVQEELRQHLRVIGRPAIPQGSVVRTGPGPLAVKHIFHIVGVNAFYESSPDAVAAGLDRALRDAAALGCTSAATCAIATGFGPLTMEEFARALRIIAARDYPPIERLRVVLRRSEDVAIVSRR